MSEPTSSPAPTAERLPLPSRLLRDRLVACFPDKGVTSQLAAVEVMVQEGIGVVDVPAGQLYSLEHLQQGLGPRATFCVHDVDVDTVDAVFELHPAMVTLRRPDAALVERCRAAGVPVVVPALTPTEVQQAWQLPVSAVLVVPAEVMGASYPEWLAGLAPGVTLCARGGLGAYSARRWAEAGAVGLWLDDALLGDAVSGGQLGGLRERCQTFRQAVDEVI